MKNLSAVGLWRRPATWLAPVLTGLALLLAPSGAAQAQALPLAPASARAAVPEAGGYGILYQLDIPTRASFNSTGVLYSINNSTVVMANPARVAYYLELTNGTTTTYVWTSMANFATTLTQLGIPNPTSNNVSLHQNVSSLNVFSNVAGVTTGTNLGTGRIEMWPANYNAGNTDLVPGASGTAFDFGDQVSTIGSYGSFQVHNVTAAQTVFAYNNWGGNGGGNGYGDLGIGSQASGSGQPDWTFAYNANQYTVKRITILVNTPANNALAFDGVNNFVAGSNAALPQGNAARTLEAWVNTNSAANTAIFNYGATDNNTRSGILVIKNHLYYVGQGNDLEGTVVINDGKWHHVAASYDGTTLRLYVDGVLDVSAAPPVGSFSTTGTNWRLGSTNLSGAATSELFNGRLDEVRVYNTALTGAQIQAGRFSTTSALPANQVAYYNFDQGKAGGTNAVITSLVDQSSTGSTGTLNNFVLSGTTSNWVRSFPTITGITPTSGAQGSSVTVTGTNLADATGFMFNTAAVAPFATPTNDLSATVTVPSGATTGPVSVSSAILTAYNGPVFTVLADLVVSTGTLTSPTSIPAGAYNSIAVTPTGNGVLAGNVSVASFFTVQPGGGLSDGCSVISGAGSFTLGAGSILGICNAAGITSSGATGAVQVTGTRSFSTGASYGYNTNAAVTGNGLPGTVANLAINTAGNVTLTAPAAVSVAVGVGGAGNLVLNGNALTLLSSASGTALAVNSSTGAVVGTATVQRYIDPSLNPGPGYRHYSSPVANTTVADLVTAGFAPTLTTSYNTSATPGTTTPFPTVFGYDQVRVALANAYTPFDRGFVVPAATTTPLVVGQGYAVNIAGNQLVDFNGPLNNGPVTLSLSRAADAAAGWQLVGNPYPAPLNYALVAPTDRVNLDAAIYVYSSAGPYVGTYRAYLPPVDKNSPIVNDVLPVAQGFFVRVSAGQTSGTLTFRNSQRLTSPQATTFQRGTAGTRPLVQLELRGATGLADTFYAYAEAEATPAFDSQFDAVKLPNTTGLNLASRAEGAAEGLAIDARPVFAAATVLPLTVGVPVAGAYTLSATALTQLPTGLSAYLHDAATGQTTNLSQQPRYAFAVSPAQAQAGLSTRFSLSFSPQAVPGTHAGLNAGEVSLFPNPAHASFTVLVPAVTGTTQLRAELLNSLGQVVRRLSTVLPADGASLHVDTTGLAGGVYSLRLYAGPTTLTKRVVLQ